MSRKTVDSNGSSASVPSFVEKANCHFPWSTAASAIRLSWIGDGCRETTDVYTLIAIVTKYGNPVKLWNQQSAIIDSGESKSPLAMIISNMMAGVFTENNKVARCLLAVFSVLNAQGFFVFCQSNSGCDGGMTPTFLVIHTPYLVHR